MTHEITLTAPETADMDSIASQIASATAEIPLLSEFGNDLSVRESDLSDTPAHVRGRVVASDQADKQALIDALDGVLDSAAWGVVKYRRSAREYRRETYRDDPDYYPPECDHGLRTPATVSRDGLFAVSIDETEARVGGENATAAAETITLSPTTDARRRDRLVVSDDGLTQIHGEESIDPTAPDTPTDAAAVATLEIHPGKVVVIETESICTPETTPWEVVAQHGDVPAAFTE